MAEEAPVPVKEPLALQILDKMSQLMTAAFGLVAALAWNDAIKLAITRYIQAGGELRALFAYAVAVTVIAVVASLWIAAAINRVKERMRREHRAKTNVPGPPPTPQA